jgi:hypothetical protein
MDSRQGDRHTGMFVGIAGADTPTIAESMASSADRLAAL